MERDQNTTEYTGKENTLGSDGLTVVVDSEYICMTYSNVYLITNIERFIIHYLKG